MFIFRVCYNVLHNSLSCSLSVLFLEKVQRFMDMFVQKCVCFIQNEFSKRGFKKAVLGLSGGVDSAVVAFLATLALGKENVRALLMPSISSHHIHFDDALSLTEFLDIDSRIIQLAPFQEAFAKQEGMDLDQAYMSHLDERQKLRMGNFCARIRMALLYDCASADDALVLGTSNKSEILLGYGTIFGDLASAINPIGELYKTEVFSLAHKLGIPKHIIDKKPSADLFVNQSDEADLGYNYGDIDTFLRHFEKLSENKFLNEKERDSIKLSLIGSGFSKEMTESLCARIWNNAFKRTMPTIFSYNE